MKKGYVSSKKAAARAAKIETLKAKELKEPPHPVKINNYKTAVSTVAKAGPTLISPNKKLDNIPVVSKSGPTISGKRAQDVLVPVVNGKPSKELTGKAPTHGSDEFIPELKPRSTKKK